jgi:beta-glucosidase
MIYRRAGAPVEDRVADLLGRMTLAEKVGQVNQKVFGWRAYDPGSAGVTDRFRELTARFGGMGALYGLFRADAWSGVDYSNGLTAEASAAAARAVQRWVIDNTRLGIPVLLVEEVPHGHQALDGTVLPTNLSAGAAFDPELYARASARAAAGLAVLAAGAGAAGVPESDDPARRHGDGHVPSRCRGARGGRPGPDRRRTGGLRRAGGRTVLGTAGRC